MNNIDYCFLIKFLSEMVWVLYKNQIKEDQMVVWFGLWILKIIVTMSIPSNKYTPCFAYLSFSNISVFKHKITCNNQFCDFSITWICILAHEFEYWHGFSSLVIEMPKWFLLLIRFLSNERSREDLMMFFLINVSYFLIIIPYLEKWK